MSKRNNYRSLKAVLNSAAERASEGKGTVHATDEPFERQQICKRTREFGIGFPLGQVDKKIKQSMKILDDVARCEELLDVIVYTSAAIIIIKERMLRRRQEIRGIIPPEKSNIAVIDDKEGDFGVVLAEVKPHE